MSETRFSSRILRHFIEAMVLELGKDQFHAILSLSQLPPEWSKPETFLRMDPAESARIYTALQATTRTYYGRGARGVLLRVGQHMWNLALDDAAFGDKAQAALIKRLPLGIRRKSILEWLARSVGAQSGDMTVHTLDLDLLLVDHVSPTAAMQQASAPICYVTQGLIDESLFWATGYRFDVDEISCKAVGQSACEFKVTTAK